MQRAKWSRLPLIGSAVVGIVPALLAAHFAPGAWPVLAAAGSAIAITGLLAGGVRNARALAMTESREQQLRAAAATSESRIAALEEKVRQASALDEATGTLNRRTFLTRLDETIQRDGRLKKAMAFLLIDIDGFKKINDEAGRMVGDRVLREVGRAILAATRGTDFVGRIGGDEFAVALGECVDPRPAADRVFVALHGAMTGGANPLPVGVSIGIVTIEKSHWGVDPVELFRVAEKALASVRGIGGGRSSTLAYQAESPSPVGVI